MQFILINLKEKGSQEAGSKIISESALSTTPCVISPDLSITTERRCTHAKIIIIRDSGRCPVKGYIREFLLILKL
jgi:hypothetical protein